MNIVKDESIGSLSRSLGSGLGKALERLTEAKYNQVAERNALNKLTGVGYSPEEAAFINALPEKNRWEAAQALAPQAPQQRQFNQQEQGFLQSLPEQQRPEAAKWLLSQNQQPQQQNMQSGMQQLMQPQQNQQQPYQPQAIEQQHAQQQPLSFGEKLRGNGGANKNQAVIDRQNANWLKGQTKAYENAQQTVEILDQMEQLLNTGKVASGVKGRFAPEWLQNDETQLFDKYSNTLAGLLAQQYGVPTGMKIKFSQSQKPNISQNSGTQKELIRRLREEAQRPLLMNELKEGLIAENNYQQPSNLESRVNQLYNQYKNTPQGLRSHQELQQSRQSNPQADNQDESILGTAARGAVRSVARAGETVAGSLGDIAAAGLGLANYASNGKVPTYSEVQQYLPISAPTSEQIKQTLSKITNGYTDPQSGTEQVMDDIIGTVSAIFGPGKAKALIGTSASKLANPNIAKAIQKGTIIALPFSGITPFKRALGMGIAGEAGAKGAELLGAGPVGQAAAKVGFMMAAAGKGTSKAVDDLMEANYKAAQKGFEGKSVNVAALKKEITNYSKHVEKRALPHKEVAKDVVSKALGALPKKGSMQVADLIELKQDMNRFYGLASRAVGEGEKSLPKDIRPIIGDLLDFIKKPLSQAAKDTPEAGRAFATAEDIFRGKNTLWKATEFLKDHVDTGQKIPVGAMKGSALLIPAYLLGGLTLGAGSIPTAFAVKHGTAFMNLLKESPQAFDIWKKALLAAANEDKQAVIKNLAILDKDLTRYENKTSMNRENI